jgi:hypothetical protein
MAILRAGPWGNLTDSFQAVPSNTGADGLTFYPVNCAKADWPSQKWAAYYEVEPVEEGCCTPGSISATHYYGGPSVLFRTANPYGGDDCEYYYGFTDGFSSGSLELEIFITGGSWLYLQTEFDFPLFGEYGSTDACDPTGDYTDGISTYTVT